MKGVKCFKVVTSERESLTPTLMSKVGSIPFDEKQDLIKKLLKRKIAKVYKKGSRIKAAKGFGPLLCFNSLHYAKEWAFNFFCESEIQIIEVIGYEGESPRTCSFNLWSWTRLLEGLDYHSSLNYIPGVLAFRRIKVLT